MISKHFLNEIRYYNYPELSRASRFLCRFLLGLAAEANSSMQRRSGWLIISLVSFCSQCVLGGNTQSTEGLAYHPQLCSPAWEKISLNIHFFFCQKEKDNTRGKLSKRMLQGTSTVPGLGELAISSS